LINENFKNNWLKILNFNATRDILEEPDKRLEYVRLPLSPITINANLLYHFFELLYPKFINDQQNILDIIISDSDKKKNVLGLYLYRTKKAGIHETVETLPNDLIRIKNIELNQLDDIFNKVQNIILKKKKVRISSIRIFKQEAIDLVNKYCKNIEKISIYEFLDQFLNLIQKLFEQNLLIIYPEPIVFNFIRKTIKLFNDININTLFKIIEELLPEFNISLLLNAYNIKIIVLLQKVILKSGKSQINLKFFNSEDLGIILDDSNIINTLNIIQNNLKTEKAYYLNQNDLMSFFSEIFELAVPIKKENFKFLLQKALFGYRSFGIHWNMVPRPKIYKTFKRFLFRLLGFNLNLKKISHWAIPNLVFNYLDFYFGLNSKILFVITDQRQNRKVTHQKNIFQHSIWIEIEESSIKEIKSITKEVIFPNTNITLDLIRKNVIAKYGSPTAIIIFDKLLLLNILNNHIFGHSKFSIFRIIKTIKMFKNEKLFKFYPEFPFYKFIKKKGAISILKALLPILIDKHEF
jgi:hypothetical protein